jgi:hypothetical protein
MKPATILLIGGLSLLAIAPANAQCGPADRGTEACPIVTVPILTFQRRIAAVADVFREHQAHDRFSWIALSTAASALRMAHAHRFEEWRDEVLILQHPVSLDHPIFVEGSSSSSINPSPKVRCSLRILFTAIPSWPM